MCYFYFLIDYTQYEIGKQIKLKNEQQKIHDIRL